MLFFKQPFQLLREDTIWYLYTKREELTPTLLNLYLRNEMKAYA